MVEGTRKAKRVVFNKRFSSFFSPSNSDICEGTDKNTVDKVTSTALHSLVEGHEQMFLGVFQYNSGISTYDIARRQANLDLSTTQEDREYLSILWKQINERVGNILFLHGEILAQKSAERAQTKRGEGKKRNDGGEKSFANYFPRKALGKKKKFFFS